MLSLYSMKRLTFIILALVASVAAVAGSAVRRPSDGLCAGLNRHVSTCPAEGGTEPERAMSVAREPQGTLGAEPLKKMGGAGVSEANGVPKRTVSCGEG